MNDAVQNNALILKELEKTKKLPQISNQHHLVFEKGENDFDTSRYFYFIISGKIKVSEVNLENGHEQTLYLLSSGDMFEVTTLLDRKPHDYLIDVLERSEVIAVPLESVRKLLHEDPGFQSFFFPYVAEQLRAMENLAIDLSLYSVYQRIIRLFARFVDNSESKPNLKLLENFSHEELASMVGSVRKVVNRALQKLKQEGVIDLSRKQLKLTNLQKLLDKLDF